MIDWLGAELDEERADDRRDDADAADRQRIGHHLEQHVGARGPEEDRRQHHGGDGGDRVGLEQVGRHAGAVADVVADVVGDGGGIARIVFRDAGFDLADEIAADVGALGEDAAAKTREDRNQRGAEAERDQRIDDGAVVRRQVLGADQKSEIDRDAQEREASDQQPGDGAGLECQFKPAGERANGGLRGADVGAHRDVHADEAGQARQHRADQEADRDQGAEEVPDDGEDHDADEADRGVLALEIGLRAFAHRRRDLLHSCIAGIGGEDGLDRPASIDNGQNATGHDQPKSCHLNLPRLIGAPTIGPAAAYDWSDRSPRTRRKVARI